MCSGDDPLASIVKKWRRGTTQLTKQTVIRINLGAFVLAVLHVLICLQLLSQ